MRARESDQANHMTRCDDTGRLSTSGSCDQYVVADLSTEAMNDQIKKDELRLVTCDIDGQRLDGGLLSSTSPAAGRCPTTSGNVALWSKCDGVEP